MTALDDIEHRIEGARRELERACERFDALTDLRALALELLGDQTTATVDEFARIADGNPITSARYMNILTRLYEEGARTR